MFFKKNTLICFPHNGGVKQFSDELYSKLSGNVDFFQCPKGKIGKLFIFKHFLNRKVIFTSNNIYIYLFMIFYAGEATLILHDHKERIGSNNKEKLILFLFKIFISRFHKVIIHDNNDVSSKSLFKYKNVIYLQMPPHGYPSVKDGLSYLPECSDYDDISLLCFGRFEAYKNFEYFASVIKKIPSIRLTIAGSGVVTDELEGIIKSASNITVINKYITDSELCSLMKNHHYLALPYKDITQTGLVELAGFFYKPLILSKIQGFTERNLDSFSIMIPNSDRKETQSIMEQITNLNYVDYKSMCQNSRLNFELGMTLWKLYSETIIE